MQAKAEKTSMQPGTEYFDDSFSRLVDSLLDQHHVPGISIAVIENGKVYAKGYGLARYPSEPATPDTLFFTGSTTKAMLAAAVGRVIHQGKDENNALVQKLQEGKWTTPVESILGEDFSLEDSIATANITIEDALSHRTGLPGADAMYGAWMGDEANSIVTMLRHLGLLSKPFRTTFQYNNLMYSAVGNVLEKISGLRCGAALKDLLWDPLGMTSTFWRPDEIPESQRSDLARGYFWVEPSAKDDNKAPSAGYYVPDAYLNLAGIAPAGAAISTVTDYAKWIKALLAAASTDNSLDQRTPSSPSFINPDLFRELTTPRILYPDTSEGNQNQHLTPRAYSLGWVHPPLTAGHEHPIICHSGGLTGFGTEVYLLPNDNFGCVAMANTALTSNIVGVAVCLELISRRLGLYEETKTKLIDALKMKPPSSEKGSQQAEEGSGDNTKDATRVTHQLAAEMDSESFLNSVTGKYSNPAYGSFHITRYDVSSDETQVVYMPWITQAQRKTRDERRSETPSLKATPIGHRTWNYSLLLHPRIGESTSRSKPKTDSESTNKQETEAVFFDMEYMSAHGNAEDDVILGLPTGCEEDSSNAESDSRPFRAKKVWQSSSWNLFGAAFKVDHGGSGQRTTLKVGLRLGREYLFADGSDKPGFEKEMVWLTRLDERD